MVTNNVGIANDVKQSKSHARQLYSSRVNFCRGGNTQHRSSELWRGFKLEKLHFNWLNEHLNGDRVNRKTEAVLTSFGKKISKNDPRIVPIKSKKRLQRCNSNSCEIIIVMVTLGLFAAEKIHPILVHFRARKHITSTF